MRKAAFAVVVLTMLLITAGCSDDAAEAVTQDDYDDVADRLCEQHGDTLARGYTETAPDSDAEEAAFYTSDLIPRARAMIRRLADLGFPPDRDAEYREALTEALDALTSLAEAPFRYIDERHRGVLDPDDDYLVRLRNAFDDADVPC